MGGHPPSVRQTGGSKFAPLSKNHSPVDRSQRPSEHLSGSVSLLARIKKKITRKSQNFWQWRRHYDYTVAVFLSKSSAAAAAGWEDCDCAAAAAAAATEAEACAWDEGSITRGAPSRRWCHHERWFIQGLILENEWSWVTDKLCCGWGGGRTMKGSQGMSRDGNCQLTIKFGTQLLWRAGKELLL